MLLAVAVVALAVVVLRRAPVETRVVRLSFARPFGAPYDSFGEAAISPDGRRVVFVASTADGKSILHVRSLDALTSEPLQGTEGVTAPFWSPDSQYIAFFAHGKLKKVDASGGPPQTLCAARGPGSTGAWSKEGVILFEPGGIDPLYRVAAAGGEPVQVTRLDAREEAHRHPTFLPDGRHFVFLGDANKTENHKLRIGSLDSQETRVLVGAITNVHFAPPDHLLFVRSGSLVAQPFDTARGDLSGEPVALVENVAESGINHRFEFSVSDSGALLYRSVTPNVQISWFDRGGRRLAAVGEARRFDNFQLAPDGQRAALTMLDVDGRNADIWILDLASGRTSRFTFDPSGDYGPVWSPAGDRIFWAAQRGEMPGLYQNTLARRTEDQALPAQGSNLDPGSCSPDGRYIIYSPFSEKTGWDLYALRLDGGAKPEPYLATPFTEDHGRFSPDGRHVAYESDESGRMEIHVRAFPESAGGRQVSTGGGRQAHWRHDGRELYFMTPAGAIMSVAVSAGRASARGDSEIDFGPPRELFREPGMVNFDVAHDGERFLVGTHLEDAPTAPMTVVLNWQAALKRP